MAVPAPSQIDGKIGILIFRTRNIKDPENFRPQIPSHSGGMAAPGGEAPQEPPKNIKIPKLSPDLEISTHPVDAPGGFAFGLAPAAAASP